MSISKLAMGSIVGLASIFLIAPACADVIYVDSASLASAPDGSSWLEAYQTLEEAVSACRLNSAITEIRSAGELHPWFDPAAGTCDSIANFWVEWPCGVDLIGGFKGYWNGSNPDPDTVIGMTLFSGLSLPDPITTDPVNPTRLIRMNGCDAETVFERIAFFNSGNFDIDTCRKTIFGGIASTANNTGAILLRSCFFSGHTTGTSVSHGGAWVSGADSLLKFENCVFSKCYAEYGGAVRSTDNIAVSGRLEFWNCEFSSIHDWEAPGYGGYVSTEFTNVLMDGCFTTGAAIARHRGGIAEFWDSDVTIRNCVLTGEIRDEFDCGKRATRLSDSDPDPKWWGGVLFAANSNLLISRTSLQGKSNVELCFLEGGTNDNIEGLAIALDDGAVCNMQSCVVWYSEGSVPDPLDTLARTSTLFSLRDSSIQSTNCTFLDNSDVNNIYRSTTSSTLTLQNSIVWNNNDLAYLAEPGSATPAVSYSDVQGSLASGPGVISADPLFSVGNKLGTGSPCIDAGRTPDVGLDITDVDVDSNYAERMPWDLAVTYSAESRVQGLRVDMGADESYECGVANIICLADFNEDGVVDFYDYLDFVALFSTFDPLADINCDASVDFFDYLDFVAITSAGC